MALLAHISGVSQRRVLALCVVLGQVLGTIGFIPVRADFDESSSAPYPCKDHRCGCRTAAQCWSGACCCFTMREKVAWAQQQGIIPPEQALILASHESAPNREAEEAPLDSGSCCKRTNTASQPHVTTCCKSKTVQSQIPNTLPKSTASKKKQGTNRGSRDVHWVAMMFAKHCQGEEPGTTGLLNIGLSPTQPFVWAIEMLYVETFEALDQTPRPIATTPPVPPPKHLGSQIPD